MKSAKILASAVLCAAVRLCSAGGSEAEIPDLATCADGTKAADAKTWTEKRRPELLELFRREEYGRRPVGRPADLAFESVSPDAVMMDGKAVRKRVRASFSGPYGKGSFEFTAFIPTAAEKSPAFVLICNRSQENIDPDRGEKSDFWPAEAIVDRGYAAIAFWNGELAKDGKDSWTTGVFRVFGPLASERKGDDWGTLSAWAWGASRVLDWIGTEPSLDAAKVAVVGHSRGGKTALLAAAEDTRFAMACVNDSGCSGAKLNRGSPAESESIAKILENFPYWFCGNYRRYADNEGALPFDQHEMLALVAPRLLCVASASEDLWAGPRSEFAATLLAGDAWRICGKEALGDTVFPEPNSVRANGCVQYQYRRGKHDLTRWDWARYMDFADRHWKTPRPR